MQIWKLPPIPNHLQVIFSQDLLMKCSKTADRKSTRLNSSHLVISYAVFCLKKKKKLLHLFAQPPFLARFPFRIRARDYVYLVYLLHTTACAPAFTHPIAALRPTVFSSSRNF